MKPKSDNVVEQKSEPWGPAQPVLKNILNQGQQLYNQGSSYYPFSTVVPQSQQTLSALQGIEGRAGSNPVTAGAQGTLSSLLSGNNPTLQATARGDYLSPDSNPWLKQTFDAMSGDVQDAVNSQFSMASRTGSPAHAGELTRQLGRLGTQLYGDNYARERQNQLGAAGTIGQQQLSALGMAPSVNDLGYGDLSKLLGAGAAYEGQAGKTLQDAMSRWDFSQNQGWNNLSRLAQLVNPVAGQGGTQTSPNTAPSGAQQGLGSTLALLSLFA